MSEGTRTFPAFRLPAVDTSSLFVAVGVVAILMVMIIPLPPVLLDLLLSFNITVGILILLVAMYNTHPLDFSAFPSLLLVTTLFRLSLNIASTRLILLHGHEGLGAVGKVITAFGTFVVGGSYAVGLIIFSILVLINFIVITKGSGRIAEVAARFTLDAMPGKQMAIDADLNAGLINEDEAKRRREEISRQSEFYGAMDGASKFVRGEAIAGLVIMAINIIGGLFIGVIINDLSISQAVQTYTLLTIGDGLVSQVPALIISTSAGVIVSRAASNISMGKEFLAQFGRQPQAMAAASGIIILFSLIPGLPHLPFLVLGLATGGLSIATVKRQAREEESEREEEEKKRKESEPPPGSPETIEALLPLDILELEVGYALVPLVDESQEGDLLERIRAIRRQFAMDMGIIIPPMHVRDNLQLKPDEYCLIMKGVEIARGSILTGYYLAMDPGAAKRKIEGIPTTEPAFGLPAIWITEDRRDEAQVAGYTVVDPSTVIATHLTEVLRSHAAELLGRQDTQKLLDNLAKTHPKVVEELTPGTLPLGTVQKVLQKLLAERVSIRDMLTICETLADHGANIKDPDILTELVRQNLARSITKQYTDDGAIRAITLSTSIEDLIRESVQQGEHGTVLNMSPDTAQALIDAIEKEAQRVMDEGYQPVIICAPVVRRHLRRIIERFLPQVAVLSHAEISGQVKIESMGTIDITRR